MRRWSFLHRLLREIRPHDGDRCILVVEQLEEREVLSPVVFVPPFSSPPQTPEEVAITFSGETGFSASDPNSDGQGGFQAVLTATNGTLAIDPLLASSVGVSVANSGTATVTLLGPLYGIDTLLASGVTFTPTPTYSGDASVALTVTDPTGGPPGTGSVDVHVTPVASNPTFSVQSTGEVRAPASGFVFPPGFVSVGSAPDLDNTETVTVTFSLSAPNPAQFTLSAGGTPLTQINPGLWQITGNDQAALQATLDSLVLTPPAGFTGRANLVVSANVVDQVTFLDGTSASDSRFLGSGDVPLRFFQGGSVTAPPVVGQEGGTLDLGGRYTVSDPDELPGDTHTLTVTVPQGTLTSNPAAAPPGLIVVDPSTTITLTGTIAEINAFLTAPGSLTYTPDPHFAGIVPLTFTLTNTPGGPPSGGLPGVPSPVVATSSLAIVPVADPVFPSASNVTTNQDTPVALSIGLSGLSGIDSAESVLVVLNGVPTGASFNRGTNLGNGQWAFAPSDLAGLTFTPPPGATGVFTFVVRVVVTDSVPGLPSNTATESTAFTVTVLPVVSQLPPVPTNPAVLLPASVSAGGSVGTTSSTGDTVARPGGVVTPGAGFVNAYSSGATVEGPSALTVLRESNAPASGSLFAQVEPLLPSYGGGERHPLPPVLPLDQTLPVAGFTESGGDSLALVDKLYRDAANTVPPTTTVSQAPPKSAPNAKTNTERVTPALPGVASADTPTTPDTAEATEGAGGEWRTWAAAGATGIAGALAALVWMGRGPDGFLARTVRRFFRAAHRLPIPSRVEPSPLGEVATFGP